MHQSITVGGLLATVPNLKNNERKNATEATIFLNQELSSFIQTLRLLLTAFLQNEETQHVVTLDKSEL